MAKPTDRKQPVRMMIAGVLAWIVAIVFALKFGATGGSDPEIVAQIRLPRVILASAVGMGLSVAGATLQALFANPLCEPYTLGISSGAALGAVIGVALGLEMSMAGLAGSAFLGALVFAFVLYLIARRTRSASMSLLLAGVVMGFFGSSLVALWMALADSSGVQGAMLWLMGDLSRARPGGSVFTFTAVLILALMVWSRWRALDAFLMGEDTAGSLGVSVSAVRRRLVIILSLLIGLCVSAAGMIGFVGLVVPHFARRQCGSVHLGLLPACAVWGAAVLVLADLVARVAARPYELPVGVVTALVGTPLFMWMILRRGRDVT